MRKVLSDIFIKAAAVLVPSFLIVGTADIVLGQDVTDVGSAMVIVTVGLAQLGLFKKIEELISKFVKSRLG